MEEYVCLNVSGLQLLGIIAGGTLFSMLGHFYLQAHWDWYAKNF
jgi:hypothetical protein